MDKISNTSKAIIVAVVVCFVILLIFIYGGRNQNPISATSNITASSNVETTTNASATIPTASSTLSGGAQPSTSGSGKKTKQPSEQVPPPPIIIRFITPVVNDVWKIGVTNPISWNNAANFTGEIDLLDGSGNFLGVILSQTGPDQTSYGWDTREYSLARYNPLKKEMVPGSYRIELKFDGNNLPPITGPVITVTN